MNPTSPASRGRRRRAAALHAVLMAAALASAVLASKPIPAAQHGGSADVATRQALAGPHAGLTLDQAIAMAERTYKARVVRADTQHEGDRIVYVLRLLNGAGRVWTVRVDAQSGRMQ